MDRRSATLSQVLILFTFLLGSVSYFLFSANHPLPFALKLLIAGLPFCFLPFAIGWISPAWWWTCTAGIIGPLINAVVVLFTQPNELSRELVALASVFLPLLTALPSAFLGRVSRQRRLLENTQSVTKTYVALNRFGILAILLLITLSCVVLWAVLFLKIPVYVTLMDGQIRVQPVLTKGWGGIRFNIENQGTQPHQFIMIYTELPADRLPVNNGIANLRSPEIMVIDDGLAHVGSHDILAQLLSSPPLQPGEKRAINYGYSGLGSPIGSQTITILCNFPGHYESGEYASVTFTE